MKQIDGKMKHECWAIVSKTTGSIQRIDTIPHSFSERVVMIRYKNGLMTNATVEELMTEFEPEKGYFILKDE